MKNVQCRCETVIEMDVPDIVDIDQKPELLDSLVDGSFMSVACPRCGADVKPELPLRVRSESRGVDLFVIPEMERLTLYRGKADVPAGAEALVGYQELFERARMLRDGLDPRAVEALKYVLQGKAEESDQEADVTVLYNGSEGDRLAFHILGLKSGETGVIKLPRPMYDRTKADVMASLGKEPYRTMFAGVYKSMKKLGFLEEASGAD